jgi:NitT/TauT family transport system substrate-binding protein
MVLRRYLHEHGIPEAAVQVVGVGTSHRAVEALRAGEIDAVCNVEPVISLLEARSEVRIVADTRSLKGTVALFGGPMPTACLYADAGFVRTHPGTCQALANGSVRALKWLRTAGPSDLMQVVPRADPLGDAGLFVAVFQKVSEAFAPDGLMPEGGPPTALRAMLELRGDIAPERIDLSRSYTDRFALAAKQRFKA